MPMELNDYPPTAIQSAPKSDVPYNQRCWRKIEGTSQRCQLRMGHTDECRG